MFIKLGQVCKHGCKKRVEKTVVFPYVCSWALSGYSELLETSLFALPIFSKPAYLLTEMQNCSAKRLLTVHVCLWIGHSRATELLYPLLLLCNNFWKRTARTPLPTWEHINHETRTCTVAMKLLRPGKCLCTDTWSMGRQVLKVRQSNSNTPNTFILASSPVWNSSVILVQYLTFI